MARCRFFPIFTSQIGENTYNWYVFNLADVAIVAESMALLYDLPWVPAAKCLIPADTGSF